MKTKSENPMRQIRIDKVILNVGGIGEELEKGAKLLKFLTGRNPAKMKSTKRIPSLGVRPGLEVGAVVTLRKDVEPFIKKMLVTIDNKLRRRQIAKNQFSFGIKEYIEIPGLEYQRDIGMRGFDVTIVFKRSGRRVRLKKIKRGKVSLRQDITPNEIIKFMEEKYGVKFFGKEVKD
ncbi:50S ribosomal protein L5 [Candidatus Pacearchaeota archaeon]|nr:50S ribosomal protein L5 [Candidatus Pacearchaeota archaeon]